jgi:hypothetical protein
VAVVQVQVSVIALQVQSQSQAQHRATQAAIEVCQHRLVVAAVRLLLVQQGQAQQAVLVVLGLMCQRLSVVPHYSRLVAVEVQVQ